MLSVSRPQTGQLCCLTRLACEMIEARKVIEQRSVAELVLIFGLHHGGSLRSKHSYCRKQVYHTFTLQPFEGDAQSDEGAGTSDTCRTVYRDGAFLAELFFGLVDLESTNKA